MRYKLFSSIQARVFEIFTKSYDIAVINPKTYNYAQYLHNRLCIPGCEIYVKNDADGKYFPQTEIDGHTYELMTDEKEQRSIAFIKAMKNGEIEVKVTNNNEKLWKTLKSI